MAALSFQLLHSPVGILMALAAFAAAASAASPRTNSTAAAAAAAAAASPSCQRKCGDVEIPYPFGIGAGCFRDGFDLICNRSLRPPRPFIGNTSIELIDVSLTLGRARAYTHIDWVCYNATNYVDYEFVSFDLSTRPAFTISADENRFTAVGCATVAVVEIDEYATGCVSTCSDEDGLNDNTCDGSGCCQTAIRKGMTAFYTAFADEIINNSLVWKDNPCSYAFIVDRNWYNFSRAHLRRNTLIETYKSGVPLVLDWSVGNMTICEEARRNLKSPPASYACADKNSECFSSSTGEGYICNCTRGYKGNPYISGGCQDIDECRLPSEYSCYGICTNTIGNYTCSCPQGKKGDPTTKDGCQPTTSNTTLTRSLRALIATMSSILFLTISGFSIYLGLKKRKLMKTRQKFFQQNGGVLLQQQMHSYRGVTFQLFTQEELKKATDNFSSSRIIGRGGQGTVYEGTLEDSSLVAIKKSKLVDERQTKEFAKEMLILSQINHKNIIKLLGCCLEVEVPMLVYELVPKGNLFEYLHCETHRVLPLDARLRIAVESAEALAYLHSSASTPIIHGDVKSSNILLDDENTAKVSDFGASKLAPKDSTQLATFVQGTCGYLDPEYMLTCQLTEKSDVFSFGVVILELLSRKKALEFNASGEEMMLTASFISAMKANKVEEMVDPEIKKEEEDMVVIKEVCKLVLLCLNFNGEGRPTMKEVAEDLGKLSKF